MGQLCDGLRGSRVTKDDPFPSPLLTIADWTALAGDDRWIVTVDGAHESLTEHLTVITATRDTAVMLPGTTSRVKVTTL